MPSTNKELKFTKVGGISPSVFANKHYFKTWNEQFLSETVGVIR